MLDRTSSGRPAAFIYEVILSAGGIIECPSEYLKAMRYLCNERGTLMIVDEAQTGFGRTGDWFAYEAAGVIPDIITVSKALGGGIPMCAAIVSNELVERLYEKRYYQSSSHTGDPLLAAASYANLCIIQEEGLLENTKNVGNYFKRGLLRLQEHYDQIGDVRGRGLILGLEIVEDPMSKKAAGKLAEEFGLRCQKRGLLVGHIPGVVSEHYIRFLPPLIVTKDEVDRALNIMEDVLSELVGKTPKKSFFVGEAPHRCESKKY
jgi:2,2-dialkylglycine decarboxylase (pyruvate)